ncbi:NUDIX domain-containing protein [Candidatus Dojkabacteria bacterium]|nr:NUDIX domain-containing protein [Candidatus Dojkabacteria bacterium]
MLISGLYQNSILVEESDWKGVPYVTEIYDSIDFDVLSPVTQVQAVCFLNKKEVVLYEHVDGYYGLPGGHVKEGEDIKTALEREISEEIACKLVDFGPVCYAKTYKKDSPEKVSYNLRFWAKVELLDSKVKDPDNKALRRVVVPFCEAPEKLAWGKKGEVLLRLATARFDLK